MLPVYQRVYGDTASAFSELCVREANGFFDKLGHAPFVFIGNKGKVYTPSLRYPHKFYFTIDFTIKCQKCSEEGEYIADGDVNVLSVSLSLVHLTLSCFRLQNSTVTK